MAGRLLVVSRAAAAESAFWRAAAVAVVSESNWRCVRIRSIGTGVEYAVTRNWIVGFESNYYRFESKSYEIGGGDGFYTFNSRPRDVYTFLGRLSFKFDMAGPVVANY